VRLITPDIVYGSVGFCGEGGPWERALLEEPNDSVVRLRCRN